MNKNLLLATFTLVFILGQAGFANAQSATYRVTFQGEWTAAATPGGVPSGAHFSPLIGAVHNDQATFWRTGATASAGIESMAEIGGTSALKREIAAAGQNVHVTLESSVPFGGTPTAGIEFTVTASHSLVTLVTMVAPSPDWFVGVSSLPLRENGDWLASKTVELFPYDAGTEDGTEFSLGNPSTSPQGVITSIRGTGKFSNEPIATLTFTLENPPDDPGLPTDDTGLPIDDPGPPTEEPDPPIEAPMPPPVTPRGDGGLSALSTAGAGSGAVFSGGATVNGGVSYLAEVPASEPADLIVSFRPAPGDVGRDAHIYVILNVPGLGYFQKISGGIWLPLNLADLSGLQPYERKTLGEQESIRVVAGLIGNLANMAGMTLNAHVAYAVGGNLAAITYNDAATPARLHIAAAAGDSCPANTVADPEGGVFKGKPVCVLSSMIASHTHLTANFSYLLEDRVIVGGSAATRNPDKVRLTIDAGTTVFAPAADGAEGYLVIDRGGQLHANGSRERPVVFTYGNEDGADESTTGLWGGLVLNGAAPLNVGGGVTEDGGASGEYGGDNPGDSSGVLTFVQVKYAGRSISGESRSGGIAFRGVGWGTLIDHVQVHNSSTDGIGFFGGAANARHILLTGNGGNSLDWTEGWRGKLQFVAIRPGGNGEYCIEGSNNSDDKHAAPRAFAVISNITCTGAPDGGTNGLMLNQGTSARIANAVIGDFGAGYCVDINDDATFVAAGGSIAGLNGSLTLSHSRLAAGCVLDESDEDRFSVAEWFGAQVGSMRGGVDPGGSSGLVNGPMLNAVAPSIPDDPFFEQVDHIGAISDAANDWTSDWTHFP